MAIRRHMPQTHEKIMQALMMAVNRNSSIPVPDRFLSASTEARLNAIEASFRTAMQNRGNKLAEQSKQTTLVNAAFDEAQIHISHFIQVFDLGVARKKFPKAARAYYGLPTNSKKLPRLRREDDITHWGGNLVAGDANRIADGGAAMSNPSIAEVQTVVDDFRTKNLDQSNKKDAYGRAQKEVNKLVAEARKVIRKVWDEVETFYNEHSAPSRRRKAREWGVVYSSDVLLTFNFVVTDANGHAIDAAIIELDETGNIIETKSGTGQMKSQVSDFATFIVKHANFPQQKIEKELQPGEKEFNIEVKMM
jgi:hypothetical protein